MKPSFTRTSAAALLSTLTISCLPILQAHAADSGSLTVNANVAKSTCLVFLGDDGEKPEPTSYKVLNLGNHADVAAGTAGSTFGVPKTVFFFLKDPVDPTTTCAMTGVTDWALTFKFEASNITTIGTKKFLVNSVSTAAGGTDAVVVLSTGGNQIDLQSGLPTQLLTLNRSVKAGSLVAQFARASTTAPTRGIYNFQLPLSVIYK